MNPITQMLSATMALAACAAMPMATLHAAETSADYFKNKTINFVVSTMPGGGADFYSRLMARHMVRFLPGSNIVVRNMPGAGNLIGLNHIYNADPDGLTIGNFTQGLIYTQILGNPSMRADLTKMSWIGKQASDARVVYMSSVAPFKTWDDLRNAKRTILFGASGLGSGAWTDAQIIVSAWNLNAKVLSGYSGNESILAMLRGEFDGRVGGRSSQESIRATDPGNIVLQFSEDVRDVTRARDVAVTPLQKKVVDLLGSQSELEAVLAGPPNIPQDRLAALREAFRQAHLSPEYRAEASKSGRPVDDRVMSGEDVAKAIAAASDAGPDLTALLKQYTSTEPQ